MNLLSRNDILDKVFFIQDNLEFEALALKVFQYQAQHNPVYKKYISILNRDVGSISRISEVPFLPVEIFKTEKVLTACQDADLVFTSSTTTGSMPARHFVPNPELYQKSFLTTFRYFYGQMEDYCILALLPSYLERSGSSLIYMMDHLIRLSNHTSSGFYLNNLKELHQTLSDLKKKGQKTILTGVTFALIDFTEKYPIDFPELIVMETGGMKGKRRELVREEVHSILKNGFGVNKIHSEYGMTELLSQAYSKGEGIFESPPWMRVMVREPNDPYFYISKGKTGGINVIDLANIDSCAFVETHDLGRMNVDGTFEVLGRFDTSDLRGCNLMVL